MSRRDRRSKKREAAKSVRKMSENQKASPWILIALGVVGVVLFIVTTVLR